MVVTSGVTLTNGVKPALAAWFTCGKRVFHWRYLLIAGVLLMVGRLVRPAAVFGVIYLALMYVLNPPHFGHTGESHFMYIDRNVIEIVMLFCVIAWRRREKPDGEEA